LPGAGSSARRYSVGAKLEGRHRYAQSAASLHRVDGIAAKIHHHLMQLGGIPHHDQRTEEWWRAS
jgi:hypothetical protein